MCHFLSSLPPKPLFILLFCSYKLIQQTRFVRWEDMPFEPGMIAQSHTNLSAEDNAEEFYSQLLPKDISTWDRVKFVLGKVWYSMF